MSERLYDSDKIIEFSAEKAKKNEKPEKPKKSKQKENPHDKHRERVRKRFVNEGLKGFEDHEVLELLLFYVIPRIDTNETAHRFLREYGSISNLLDATCEDLQKRLGVKENVAVLLTLIPQISQRYMQSRWEGRAKLTNPEKAGRYCMSFFEGKNYENFAVLCLDAGKNLIATTLVSEGSVDEVHVYPRKVVETALRFHAVSVVLSHNHPGGTLKASFEDIELTKRISEALKTVGISVSDHIIVCGTKYMSFAEKKIL